MRPGECGGGIYIEHRFECSNKEHEKQNHYSGDSTTVPRHAYINKQMPIVIYVGRVLER